MDQSKSLPTLVQELWDLVLAYARQETLDPLRDLGRFLAFGLAGALSLAIGLVLLFLAALRALQSETGSVFVGGWSWVPYLVALAGCLAVAAVVMRARTRLQRRSRR